MSFTSFTYRVWKALRFYQFGKVVFALVYLDFGGRNGNPQLSGHPKGGLIVASIFGRVLVLTKVVKPRPKRERANGVQKSKKSRKCASSVCKKSISTF